MIISFGSGTCCSAYNSDTVYLLSSTWADTYAMSPHAVLCGSSSTVSSMLADVLCTHLRYQDTVFVNNMQFACLQHTMHIHDSTLSCVQNMHPCIAWNTHDLNVTWYLQIADLQNDEQENIAFWIRSGAILLTARLQNTLKSCFQEHTENTYFRHILCT